MAFENHDDEINCADCSDKTCPSHPEEIKREMNREHEAEELNQEHENEEITI